MDTLRVTCIRCRATARIIAINHSRRIRICIHIRIRIRMSISFISIRTSISMSIIALVMTVAETVSVQLITEHDERAR